MKKGHGDMAIDAQCPRWNLLLTALGGSHPRGHSDCREGRIHSTSWVKIKTWTRDLSKNKCLRWFFFSMNIYEPSNYWGTQCWPKTYLGIDSKNGEFKPLRRCITDPMGIYSELENLDELWGIPYEWRL